MNDRYRGGSGDDAPRDAWEPGTPETVSGVLDLDQLIDGIAAGRVPRSGDRLLELLSAARAELDDAERAHPVTPPDLSALLPETADDGASDDALTGAPAAGIPVGRHRRRPRRGLRLTGRAAAVGGLSVTGMVIAGGVAAALAVGGLGVAAYHGAIPGIPARGEVSGPRDAGETSTSVSGTPVDRTRATVPSGATRPGAPEKTRTAGTTVADQAGAPGTSGQPETTEVTEDPEPTGVPGTEPVEPTVPPESPADPGPTDTPVESTGSPESPADPEKGQDTGLTGDGVKWGQGQKDDILDTPDGDLSGNGTGD